MLTDFHISVFVEQGLGRIVNTEWGTCYYSNGSNKFLEYRPSDALGWLKTDNWGRA